MSSFDTIQSLIAVLSERKDQLAVLAYEKNGHRSLSYGQLAANIDLLSKGLIQSGITKGDHAILMANNSPEWIIACLAAVNVGAVVVPLDPQLDDITFANIVRCLNAKIIFSTFSKARDFDSSFAKVILLDEDNDERSWKTLLTDNESLFSVSKPNETAALFYTSGTMATPKGVPLSHGNLMYQINSLLELGLAKADDRILQPLPFHHIYPFTIGMLFLLASGLPIIMPESLSGPQLVRAIQEGAATGIVGVPRLYSALYDAIISGLSMRGGSICASIAKGIIAASGHIRERTKINIGKFILHPITCHVGRHLRILACGGAPLDPGLARKLEGLGWQVAIGYGLTETSPLITIKLPGRGSLQGVGSTLPRTDIRIDPHPWLNKLTMQTGHNSDRTMKSPEEKEVCQNHSGIINVQQHLVKASRSLPVSGEIMVRGPGVFAGYFDLPEKNAETFTPDGWFRTGDLGYISNSELYVLGRISSLIVTPAGKKIEPDELEDFYCGNPVIKEIGILQRSGKLLAVISPNMTETRRRGGWDLDRIVRDAIDERSLHLPTYKRLSGYVLSQESLARTAMGKTKRHKLEEQYDNLSMKKEKKSSYSQVMPKISDEDHLLFENQAVSKVWKYLEDRYGPCLSLDANPQLDLGVDSLEWLGTTLDIRNCCGVDLDESAIAGINTIRGLLLEVSNKSRTPSVITFSDPLLEPEKHISSEQKRWLTKPGAWFLLVQYLFYCIDYILSKLFFRVRVVGIKNILASQNYVFTPNHASYLDPFVLAAALPFPRLQNTYWAGWTGIAFANFVVRSFSKIAQAIPIDADQALISSLALGASVLKRGKSLVWFPEGRRSLTGELLPFKRGLGLLLRRYPVPVVPVLLKRTADALPPGSWRVKPLQVTVIFGKPVWPHELEQEGKGSNAEERIVDALQKRMRNLDQEGELTARKEKALHA